MTHQNPFGPPYRTPEPPVTEERDGFRWHTVREDGPIITKVAELREPTRGNHSSSWRSREVHGCLVLVENTISGVLTTRYIEGINLGFFKPSA